MYYFSMLLGVEWLQCPMLVIEQSIKSSVFQATFESMLPKFVMSYSIEDVCKNDRSCAFFKSAERSALHQTATCLNQP